MDMKQQVKEYIINDQKQRISELKQLLDNIQAQSDIDEASVIDPEDLTRQSEATDMRLIQQARLVEAEDELLLWKQYPTTQPKKLVLAIWLQQIRSFIISVCLVSRFSWEVKMWLEYLPTPLSMLRW